MKCPRCGNWEIIAGNNYHNTPEDREDRWSAGCCRCGLGTGVWPTKEASLEAFENGRFVYADAKIFVPTLVWK